MESLRSASISAWSILSFIITIEITEFLRSYNRMSTSSSQEVKYSANAVLRSERLKEIDALYRNQMKEIYAESKLKAQREDLQVKREYHLQEKIGQKAPKINIMSVQSPHSKSSSTLNAGQSSAGSKVFPFPQFQDKTRASTLLKGQSTRTIEFLRKDNETKQLKIRQLTNKCQALIQKLKESLSASQFQKQIDHLKEHSDNKMVRLENLFKIKSDQIFFKVKLQIINLLQEFGVAKEELQEINDIANEGTLFTFMTKRLKGKLKDFRDREQESGFELQKDKIMSQKQEERIHYLVQTNELLRLSQTKLKSKVEDLKAQLNEFLQKLRQKQVENEQLESQVFQIKKQYEQLNATNLKLSHSIKVVNSQKIDERRTWQAKQKQMKNLLNNYLLQKKKLQSDVEEAEGRIQEILIQQKYIEQENERLNRELVRWKERYEWIEKENDSKIKELQGQLGKLSNDFDQYKMQHNQAIIISHQNDVEEALRKVEQYQRAYESILLELQDEKRLFARAEEQYQQKISNLQKQWLERVKRLEKIREEELFEFQNDHEARQKELRDQYQKKEKLFAQEMQAHMRALLAEKDKKSTEQMVFLQSQNDTLRRQIQSLKDFLRAKEDFINIIRSHSK